MSKSPRGTQLAEEAIELVWTNDVKTKYPHDLPVVNNSAFAIARAIAPKHDLLLLDEHFELDPDFKRAPVE